MAIWQPDLTQRSGAIYSAIADAIGGDIESGLLKPGDRLPPQRDLARALGVNAMTVSRAYTEAARRGWVEGEVGRGTFVSQPKRASPRVEPLPEDEAGLIDFHFNIPHAEPSILDVRGVLMELAAAERVPLHVGYTATGSAQHRQAAAAWLQGLGVPADAERMLICGGVQHAMTVVFTSLMGPGDIVATEELTYPGMIALSNTLGFRLSAVPMDSEGLLPEAFEALCRKGGVRALYCMPTVHNPTGGVLHLERRLEIARVARQYDVAIVEDDSHAFLHESPPASFAELAPDLTYHLSGTSKPLSAGLRIGFLLAPNMDRSSLAAVPRLAATVAATSWMAAPLMAEITARWIHGGEARQMIEWKRGEAQARRRIFDAHPGLLESDSHALASHVWMPLPEPWRSADFVAQARQHGVAVTPTEAFVFGRAHAPHAVRICLGTPATHEQMTQGLDVLAEILDSPPDVYQSII